MSRIRKVRGWSLALVLSVGLSAATAVAAEAREYVLDPAHSSITLHVGKTGLFSAFGHEHDVVARAFLGSVRLPQSGVSGAQVSVTFAAGALRVQSKGEPPEDVPKVQATMVGPEVLAVQRFPWIVIKGSSTDAREVGPGAYEAKLSGTIQLHGVTRPLNLSVRTNVSSNRLTADGKTTVRQTDFGITPVTAGGGTVKVEDEVTVTFHFVGQPKR